MGGVGLALEEVGRRGQAASVLDTSALAPTAALPTGAWEMSLEKSKSLKESNFIFSFNTFQGF